MSSGISIRDGGLFVDQVAATTLAAEFGTPLYVYSATAIAAEFKSLRASLGGDHLACFAVKANGNLAVLRTIANCGGGADVVSIGELRRAEKAGFDPQKMVFSGVGKTAEELEAALQLGISQLNVESAAEFELLASLGRKNIPVAFRVNPQLSFGGHSHIRTARRGDKFGIPKDEAMRLATAAAADEKFRFMGLSMHLGSQIVEQNAFAKGWGLLADYAAELAADGIAVTTLDGGGGLGLGGKISIADWGRLAVKTLADHCHRLIIEPGRRLVGSHGVLLTKVIRSKKSGDKNWLIVDAAMNDLARPSLYGAEHPLVAATAIKGEAVPFAVAGPVCESGDVLAKKAMLPPPPNGALLALLDVGAYGSAMGSAYNGRPLTGEVLVGGDKYAAVRKPVDAEALMGFESIPHWLDS